MTAPRRVDGRAYVPTVPQPSIEELQDQDYGDDGFTAIDGCGEIEMDGYCADHEQPSWCLYLGLV